MKNILKNTLLVGSLLLGSTAQAGFPADQIKSVIKTIKDKGGDSLCRKGDITTGTFSLRSFEGRLCTIKPIAALAITLCAGDKKKESGFRESQCTKNAYKILGVDSKSDSDYKKIRLAAKMFLKMESKKSGGPSNDVKDLMCTQEAKDAASPDEQATIAEVCGAEGA